VTFELERLERRRRVFENAGRVTCPCCGYPTIPERGAYEICSLCAWEDEGEPVDPATVTHGANHDYSLAEARANFARDLTSFRPSDIDFERERGATPIKREIVKAFDRAVDGLTDVERAEDDARYLFAKIYGI
jgi:hypothetical protein